MAKNSRRLGRGLNSLISSSIAPEEPLTAEAVTADTPEEPHRIAIAEDSNPAGSSRVISKLSRIEKQQEADQLPPRGALIPQPSVFGQQLLSISVESITPNTHQPRKSFDLVSIGRLARSLAESGVLQPLLVRLRPNTDSSQAVTEYELIAGERRWRAAKAAGIATVPAIVKEAKSDASMEMALVENIQREDLNAVDRARAYQAYCERTGLSAEEAGRRLGEDRTTITNYMRLLELPDSVMQMVATGTLGMGHARAILGCPDQAAQIELAEKTVTQGLSVRAVETLVRERKSTNHTKNSHTTDNPKRPDHLGELEEKLQHSVKTKVKIQPGSGPHRGKIIIDYYTLDDFDRISGMLGYSEKDAQ